MHTQDSSHSSLRTINQQKILSEIVLAGAITRTELTNRTGLTNASVSRITKSLIDSGLIIESDQPIEITGPGRRFVNLTVNPKGGYVLGIKINALRQSIVVLDLAKNELGSKELNLKSLIDPDLVLRKIANQAQKLIRHLKLDTNRILGIGVAITGAVNSEQGLLIEAPTLGWKKVQISAKLNQLLGFEVHIENLPNAINLCEHRFGITSEYQNVVAINAALGIGSSLILDNQLIRGSTNSAGLLGQLSFTDSGHYQDKTVDDLTAGWRVLSELGHPDLLQNEHRKSAKKLTKILATQDDSDRHTNIALQKAGKSLGRVLELYIAMVNPDAILISGPLAKSKHYLDGITKRLPNNSADILTSRIFGSTAASWLAINEFLIQRPIDLNKFTLQEAA